MNRSEDVEALLSTPEAKAHYLAAKGEPWLAAFRNSNEVHRRLGARLILEEVLDRLEPDRAEALQRDVVLEAMRESGFAKRRGRPEGWRKPASQKRRGDCPVCRADVSIKLDGTCRKHEGRFFGEACLGSGRLAE